MDLFIELCEAFCPTILIVVSTIVAWRKLPSKRDWQDAIDSFSAEIKRCDDMVAASARRIHGKKDRFSDETETEATTTGSGDINADRT